ncbi:MAG: type IV pilus assembly protein PilM [Candidatus Sacchiramonaceae bacterium]|nr:type IV pilus assembly protein PilM [Candidatus Saccharimonadaceae bacterium]
MLNIKGVGEFFSLDIGTNAIRVVQLDKGNDGNWNLVGFGYTPIDSRLTMNDSEDGRRKLGEVIATAVGQSDIKTKNVAISLSSQKTFTTIIDVPVQDAKELQKTIKYQIDQYVPMSIEDAKVDWASLGQSMHKKDSQEVLLASTSKNYSEDRLEFIEGLGFNVVAAEPDSLAMTRSLLPKGVGDGRVLIDLGENSTDLSVVYGDAPRLVRTIPVGLSSLVKAAVQNLNIKDDQARQFILKFGLAQDKLEGQVFRAIETTLESFVQEIVKSIKFFSTRYPDVIIGGVVLSGYAGVVPHLTEYVSSKTGIATVSGNPFQYVTVPAKYQQQLSGVASEFAVAVGLAQRSNK